jgi:hypothetical protein
MGRKPAKRVAAANRCDRERQTVLSEGLEGAQLSSSVRGAVALHQRFALAQQVAAERGSQLKQAVCNAFASHVPVDENGAPTVSATSAARAAELLPALVEHRLLGRGERIAGVGAAKAEAREEKKRADHAEEQVCRRRADCDADLR